MLIGIVRETCPRERRVALTPAAVRALLAKGVGSTIFESGAGQAAGFDDEAYAAEGAKATDRQTVFAEADLVCQVRTFSANPEAGREDLGLMRSGQTVIGFCDALGDPEPVQQMAETGVRSFAMELVPRITRAQGMDALSSQAMIAGYKAAVVAAGALPKIFPMAMTAAGTVAAARVLVLGAGVAGLQAIATCKRLGAVVSAYDIRAAAREEAESVGAKFLRLDLETGEPDGSGQYARERDERFYEAQRKLMAEAVAKSDVVICTAAVPGRRSPVLVDRAMVESMRRGSVIVDLAAERGGNCELTQADQVVVHGGVSIHGPTNLPATVPMDASQLYARNLAAFCGLLIKEGRVEPDMEDEIVRQTLLTDGGEVVRMGAAEGATVAAAGETKER